MSVVRHSVYIFALVAPLGSLTAQAVPPPPDSVPSSAYLSLLPEGPEKRAFILDCTGCHQFHKGIAFLNGESRSRDSWHEAVARMLAYTANFPVISEKRDPAATADWLIKHLPDPSELSLRPASLPARGEVTEYAYPVPQDLPHDLIVDANGRVVVTGMNTHQMQVLDPSSGAWEAEDIPVSQANPRALEIDDAGTWWVLLGNPQAIARKDGATGEWTSYTVGMYPHSIALDPQGRAWFNGHFTKDPPLLGYVDPGDGSVRTYEAPRNPDYLEGSGPIPYGLRILPDGEAWVTELHGNRIVGFDPGTGAFRAFVMPTAASGPRRPDADADGRLWIPEYATNILARFDRESESFAEYELPIPDALPYVVRVDRTRNIVWIGTGAADALIAFDIPTESFTVYPLPTTGTLVRHIDIDERSGDVWAAYAASPGIPAKVARLRP